VLFRSLKRAKRRAAGRSVRIAQFYADTIDTFPKQAEYASDLVVKTHIPSRSLQFLITVAAGRVLLTVRDPRDAIASVMQRFGHRFDAALSEISLGAQRMVEFAKLYDPPVFRYEDRFYEDPDMLRTFCLLLSVRLSSSERERIFTAHTREAVARTIETLQQRGTFGRDADPDRFEPRTHWHPGHLGDLVIGKYREILSPKQQRTAFDMTRQFCRAFGYRH